MSCLPLDQLSKSQRSAVELQIEPDAKMVQSYLRGQASLKSRQVMRTFPAKRKVFNTLSLTVSMICRTLANQRRKALG